MLFDHIGLPFWCVLALSRQRACGSNTTRELTSGVAIRERLRPRLTLSFSPLTDSRWSVWAMLCCWKAVKDAQHTCPSVSASITRTSSASNCLVFVKVSRRALAHATAYTHTHTHTHTHNTHTHTVHCSKLVLLRYMIKLDLILNKRKCTFFI